MANLTKDLFIGLSNSKFLNKSAKKWGFRLGADKFVAGRSIEEALDAIREMNRLGISCTLDNLGEFVFDEAEAIEAKNEIISILRTIREEQLDCHLSIKLTQLGLDIDRGFCFEIVEEIVALAAADGVFINIDMEKYIHYEKTLDILEELCQKYDNVGTVIQSYLYRAAEDLEKLKDCRIRVVKGAYKESADVAYQSKEEIDRNFIEIVKLRLQGDSFTSIATHDHNLIEEIKLFAEENNISRDRFEFQMLYGFRTEMHVQLVEEGYLFCTYIPLGQDWFGYFMRRLAERPQNVNLILKDAFYDKDNKLKKEPIIAGAAAVSLLYVIRKKRKIDK